MWPQLVEPVANGLPRPPQFSDQTEQPLETLVERKLYFDIIAKTQQLIAATKEPSTEQEVMDLLQVWVWRFRALLATRQGALVAQEAQTRLENLEELSPGGPVWDLRLLLVPVRANGINKNALQLIYNMAIEARTQLMTHHGSPEWTERLRRLGLEVAAVLVGMRDIPTAVHHLEVIYQGENYVSGNQWIDTVAHAITMCYVYMGDALHAAEWAVKTKTNTSLVRQFAAGNYHEVLKNKDDSVVATNLRALANLHLGNVSAAVELFEAALEHEANSSILYNLFMTFDLVESNPTLKKQQTWDQLAARFSSIGCYCRTE